MAQRRPVEVADDDLAPGDYRVVVEPAIPLPDVRPVWDALTIVDPAVEANAVERRGRSPR